MFLIDTNVVSELRSAASRRPDPLVVAWINATATELTYLSAITVMELEIGVARVARRDPDQGDRLARWLEVQVIPSFQDRILPVDTAVARRCGPLHVPDLRPDRDALIAATALVHGLTVVTRNTRDFAPMGVSLINPWEPGS